MREEIQQGVWASLGHAIWITAGSPWMLSFDLSVMKIELPSGTNLSENNYRDIQPTSLLFLFFYLIVVKYFLEYSR